MNETLYQRLGGAERIAALLDNVVDRHAVNPLLAPRFRNRDLPRIKRVATQFFCAGAGGPQVYEGRDMREVHAGMNISEQEFMAATDDIVAAMNEHGVDQPEINEVVGILYSLRGEVLRI